MHYRVNPKNSFIRRHRWVLWLLPVSCIAVGVYLLVLLFSPKLVNTPLAPIIRATTPLVTTEVSNDKKDYVVIPKINVRVAIVTGNSEAVLANGAWHRYPDRGDPVKGGNFIIAAHRFLLGWTPQRTLAKSPFYHLDELKTGDEVTIIFKGKSYKYQVTKSYSVKPNDTAIEAPSTTAKLTLYSCTLKGPADGRSVIEATPVN